MSFNNHDNDDPNRVRYAKKENNPMNQKITDLTKDKMYGLPMQEEFTIETYEKKKARFEKTETFLMNLIAETNNDKLMHTFLRWQDIRNELNEMFVTELQKNLNP